MQTQTENNRWILRADVVCTVLNEGAVILDLRSKFFYSANAGGWAIVRMFETGASRAEVLAAGRRWGANDNGDMELINKLIDQMIQEELVEPANGTPPPPADVEAAAWNAPTLEKHRQPLQRVMVSAFDPGLPLAE